MADLSFVSEARKLYREYTAGEIRPARESCPDPEKLHAFACGALGGEEAPQVTAVASSRIGASARNSMGNLPWVEMTATVSPARRVRQGDSVPGVRFTLPANCRPCGS